MAHHKWSRLNFVIPFLHWYIFSSNLLLILKLHILQRPICPSPILGCHRMALFAHWKLILISNAVGNSRYFIKSGRFSGQTCRCSQQINRFIHTDQDTFQHSKMYQRKYAEVCNSSDQQVRYIFYQQAKPNQWSNREDHGMEVVQLPNLVNEFPKNRFHGSNINNRKAKVADRNRRWTLIRAEADDGS